MKNTRYLLLTTGAVTVTCTRNVINKRITERALGTRYGKEHLEQVFLQKDPLAIIFVKSHLRLVVDLQTNIKAMQNPAYANKVKITNLKQMANTIIYLQQHDIDSRTSLESAYTASFMQQQKAQDQVTNLSLQIKDLNQQIYYTGQYLSSKKTYTAFLNSKNKGLYRKNHASEIQAYEFTRDWFNQNLSGNPIPSLKKLYEKKSSLQISLDVYKNVLSDCKSQVHELDVVRQNVDSILQRQIPDYLKKYNLELYFSHKKRQYSYLFSRIPALTATVVFLLFYNQRLNNKC